MGAEDELHQFRDRPGDNTLPKDVSESMADSKKETHDEEDQETDKPRHVRTDGQTMSGTQRLRDDFRETEASVSDTSCFVGRTTAYSAEMKLSPRRRREERSGYAKDACKAVICGPSRCSREQPGRRGVYVGGDTHMTMSTVLTTTLTMPPPRTGSEMMGRASLTIMLAKRREMRRRWPFLRMGMIFLAYLRCFLHELRDQFLSRPIRFEYSRRSADTQDLQLRLVQAHVAKRQASE